MTSLPFWATIVSQIGGDWMVYVRVSVGPLYLKEVLQLDDTELGLVAGLPYLLIIPCVYLAGSLSDRLVARGVLTNTQVRKLNDAVCKLIPAAVVLCLSYLPERSVVSVAFLNSLCTAALGFTAMSCYANPVDLAPAWAGLLSGIAGFGAMWVSFVVPVIFNYLTRGRTREEWRMAFFITAVIQVLTFAFFCVFGSGEEQPWAVEGEHYDVIIATRDKNGNHDNKEDVVIVNGVTESKGVREPRPNYGAAAISHLK